MNITQRLTLLCATAIAAMALTATNATATEPITVAEEGAAVCAPAPCTIHVVGEFGFRAFHAFTISTCESEFFADINANGTGEITQWTGINHPVDGPCTREMCTDPDPAGDPEHWPIEGTEETGENETLMLVEFCLTPTASHGSPETRCEVPIHITEEPTNNHHYFFDLFFECDISGTPVEVAGNWETEEIHNPAEEDEIEIVHSP